jgi:hypothetical protein
MTDERKDNQQPAVKTEELSESELEQASGGYPPVPCFEKASNKRSESEGRR